MWPEVGLHLTVLAKLAAAKGRLGEAKAAAQTAVSMLTVTLPRSSGAAIIAQVEQLHLMSANVQALPQ